MKKSNDSDVVMPLGRTSLIKNDVADAIIETEYQVPSDGVRFCYTIPLKENFSLRKLLRKAKPIGSEQEIKVNDALNEVEVNANTSLGLLNCYSGRRQQDSPGLDDACKADLNAVYNEMQIIKVELVKRGTDYVIEVLSKTADPRHEQDAGGVRMGVRWMLPEIVRGCNAVLKRYGIKIDVSALLEREKKEQLMCRISEYKAEHGTRQNPAFLPTLKLK